MRSFLIRTVGSEKAVEVGLERGVHAQRESYSATLDGRRVEVEIECTDQHSGWLHWHGRVIPYRAVRRNSTVDVWLEGRLHQLELVDRTAQRVTDAASASASDDLTAPMPGTILKVNVKPGDTFEAHAALIVMESMKMEMTLSAPRAGRIREVLCKSGELVEMGELLATLEEPE